MSLIGFDDIPMAEFFKVPITVVKQNPHEIGKQATQLLLERFKDKEQPASKIMIPGDLTIRRPFKSI